MPNGGYPLSLVLGFPERPDVVLHVRGARLDLTRWETLEDGRRVISSEGFGTLTREQVGALAYHLVYWILGDEFANEVRLSRRGVGPRWSTPGVTYDY